MDIKEILNAINKEDIYNIIVPVVLLTIGWIPGGIKVFLDVDKYWMCLKKKSPLSNYLKYFWLFHIAGFGIVIVYCLLAVAIIPSLGIVLSSGAITNSYLLFSIFMHIVLAHQIWKSDWREKEFAYKKEYKCKILMTKLLTWTPIVTSALLWIVHWKWQLGIINLAAVIICWAIELLAFVVLDDKSTMEFEYATFYLNDDTIIHYADSNISYQKGNWIVAKYKDSEKEFRFRRKDMKRIQYSNQKDER